jgi:hypothetical protein
VSTVATRRVLGITLAAALAVAGSISTSLARPQGGSEPDPIEAEAFRIRYQPLAGAAEVVAAVLSEEGTLTLKPRFKTLVVQDRRSVLDRIGPLVKSFDVPPRSVDVVVNLALASEPARKQEEAGRHLGPRGPYRDLRGVLETFPNIGTWQDFQLLGSRAMVGIEGADVTADLSGGYRVVFQVDSVEDERVKFSRFSLQRVEVDENGAEKVKNLYTNEIMIRPGATLMVGAARAPSSKQALFLTLQVSPR